MLSYSSAKHDAVSTSQAAGVQGQQAHMQQPACRKLWEAAASFLHMLAVNPILQSSTPSAGDHCSTGMQRACWSTRCFAVHDAVIRYTILVSS